MKRAEKMLLIPEDKYSRMMDKINNPTTKPSLIKEENKLVNDVVVNDTDKTDLDCIKPINEKVEDSVVSDNTMDVSKVQKHESTYESVQCLQPNRNNMNSDNIFNESYIVRPTYENKVENASSVNTDERMKAKSNTNYKVDLTSLDQTKDEGYVVRSPYVLQRDLELEKKKSSMSQSFKLKWMKF